jgi:hypothetical protein
VKKKIYNFLKSTIDEAYKNRALDTTYYLKLKNGYSVVLNWEEGFDTKDGCELCISLRVTDSSYFVYDWDIIGEDFSLEEDKINYEELTADVMDLMKEI